MSDIPRDAIAQLTGALTGAQVAWTDRPQRQLGMSDAGQFWIELSVTGYAGKGDDELRQKPDPLNPSALVSQIVGYRMFTVNFRAKSLDLRTQSYELLESVRWGLRSSLAAEVYRDANFAFVRAHPTAVYSGSSDSRVMLMASMDVVFSMLGGGFPDDPGFTIGQINGGGVIPGP